MFGAVEQFFDQAGPFERTPIVQKSPQFLGRRQRAAHVEIGAACEDVIFAQFRRRQLQSFQLFEHEMIDQARFRRLGPNKIAFGADVREFHTGQRAISAHNRDFAGAMKRDMAMRIDGGDGRIAALENGHACDVALAGIGEMRNDRELL